MFYPVTKEIYGLPDEVKNVQLSPYEQEVHRYYKEGGRSRQDVIEEKYPGLTYDTAIDERKLRRMEEVIGVPVPSYLFVSLYVDGRISEIIAPLYVEGWILIQLYMCMDSHG